MIIEEKMKLQELHERSNSIGLTMNLKKTKVISTTNHAFFIDQTQLEILEDYVYLGHKIKLGRENETADLTRRTGIAWASFSKIKHILKSKYIPLCMKKKVFYSCILLISQKRAPFLK